MRKRNYKNRQVCYKITPKGIAVCSAIEVGLLPEVIENGVEGYDTTKFDKFWTHFGNSLAAKYGFNSADDFWKVIFNSNTNNCDEDSSNNPKWNF